MCEWECTREQQQHFVTFTPTTPDWLHHTFNCTLTLTHTTALPCLCSITLAIRFVTASSSATAAASASASRFCSFSSSSCFYWWWPQMVRVAVTCYCQYPFALWLGHAQRTGLLSLVVQQMHLLCFLLLLLLRFCQQFSPSSSAVQHCLWMHPQILFCPSLFALGTAKDTDTHCQSN